MMRNLRITVENKLISILKCIVSINYAVRFVARRQFNHFHDSVILIGAGLIIVLGSALRLDVFPLSPLDLSVEFVIVGLLIYFLKGTQLLFHAYVYLQLAPIFYALIGMCFVLFIGSTNNVNTQLLDQWSEIIVMLVRLVGMIYAVRQFARIFPQGANNN